MPNWCSNTLYVRGDEAQVKAFVDSAKVEGSEPCVLSFNKHVPIPDDQKENWYLWNNTNWGTKWDACEAELVVHSKEYATYVFNTAWAPPQLWLSAVSRQFPTLLFQLHYDEPGMAYKGVMDARNGKATDRCINY